jgi:alkylhydroperoxidase family enzyme
MVEAVLDDHETAPIPDRLRAMLRFLHKMTQTPGDLGPDDARALESAGVSSEAARDAVYVAYVFNVYDRLADSLGFTLPTDGYAQAPKILLSFIGYR